MVVDVVVMSAISAAVTAILAFIRRDYTERIRCVEENIRSMMESYDKRCFERRDACASRFVHSLTSLEESLEKLDEKLDKQSIIIASIESDIKWIKENGNSK